MDAKYKGFIVFGDANIQNLSSVTIIHNMPSIDI